jgi:glyoxylase-like metal-dependent hydrolase (beta-lactamase superfamily II)
MNLPYEEITSTLIKVYGKRDADSISNSSFILFDKKIAVIDTGAKGELWREVLDVIKKHGRDPKKEPIYVLLTHEHPDHFGSAVDLKNASKAEIYAHSAAADTLRDPSKLATKHFGAFDESSGVTRKLKSVFEKETPTNPDTILGGGEKINLGLSSLTVIYTGGHSVGHIMFYDDYRRVLFAGDEVVEAPGNACKYIIDLTGSADRKEIVLKRLQELRIDLFAPAHDSAATGEEVKEPINRALDAHEMWKNEVFETVSRLGKASTDEIAKSVQQALSLNWSGGLKQVAATLTTAAYLRSLRLKGQVQESEEKKGQKLWTSG